MKNQEEYAFKCNFDKQSSQIYFQISSNIYQNQRYDNKLSFEQLPNCLQRIFKNLAHLYLHLQKPNAVYFDDEQINIKICVLIAGETKQFSIPLISRGPAQMMKDKLESYSLEKMRLCDEYSLVKKNKQRELETIRQTLLRYQKEKAIIAKTLNDLKISSEMYDAQIAKIRQKNQQKIKLVRSINPKQVQQRVPTSKDIIHLQERKLYWIEQVEKLKPNKRDAIKQHINKYANYQAKDVLQLRQVGLKKMLFVQLFCNLTLLDLGNNSIQTLQGLSQLRGLKKLYVDCNRLSSLRGLQHQNRLQVLVAHTNQIKTVEGIFHMRFLNELSLSNNQLKQIPNDISKLVSLQSFRIINNQVKSISQQILKCQKLKVFSIAKSAENVGCYRLGTRSKEMIDKLMSQGVKTVLKDI